MTQEALKLALEALERLRPEGFFNEAITAIKEALAQPEQEPFFTEANGFPQEFVSKDRQKQAIISMTEQCAALVWERDELQKQVWLYEKNGVTCQTYRHKVEQSCSECNVQMNYTTPPQQEPVAWGNFKEDGTLVGLSQHPEDQANWTNRKPLYTAPLQPEPVAYWKEHAQGLQRDYDSLLADFQAQQEESNFCQRCGKRTKDIHTCTPPKENT